MVDKATNVGARPEKSVVRWLSLVGRLVLGGSILLAGVLKIGNLESSVVAVRAYSIPMPNWMSQIIGYSMPIIEIVLGAVIMAGLFTRWSTLLGCVMMVVYIGLIVSAWTRGLSIDCGCFTEGGFLPDGVKTQYLQDILRDLAFLICGMVAVIAPRSPISVDNWIANANPEEA